MYLTWLCRALHTALLPGTGFPFPLTPIHVFHHHILMLQPRFTSYLEIMHTLSSRWHFIFLRIMSSCPQVAETIYEKGETLIKEEECDSVIIYLSIICFLHGHIFRSGLLRSQSTYPVISVALNASLTSWRNTTGSPRPTLDPKATTNEELGAEYLNQESCIYQEFKSIATITAGNCTLYCLKWKCCSSHFNLLKKSILITPTTSLNLTQDVYIELENGAPGPCKIAFLPKDTVLPALPSRNI